MKFFVYILSIAAMLSSCSFPEYSIEGWVVSARDIFLATDNSSLEFYSSGSSQNLGVISEGASWQIITDADWVSVNPASGVSSSEVIISVTENFSVDSSRVAILNLISTTKGYEYQKSIEVLQKTAYPKIELFHDDSPISRRTKIAVGVGTTLEITVIANCLWTAVGSGHVNVINDVENGRFYISSNHSVEEESIRVYPVSSLHNASNSLYEEFYVTFRYW